MAALGADAARQSSKVQSAFTENAQRLLHGMVQLIKGKAANRLKPKEAHEKALITLATLVGAQVIVRAVDDEKLSKDVLKIAAMFILEKHK